MQHWTLSHSSEAPTTQGTDQVELRDSVSQASIAEFSIGTESRSYRLSVGWQVVFLHLNHATSPNGQHRCPFGPMGVTSSNSNRSRMLKERNQTVPENRDYSYMHIPWGPQKAPGTVPFHVACPAQQCYSPQLKCRRFPLLCHSTQFFSWV